jgi:hypothetical protein
MIPTIAVNEELLAIATILEKLPSDHPAWMAYRAGAGTMELTQFVADRSEIVEALKEAFLAGYQRSLNR